MWSSVISWQGSERQGPSNIVTCLVASGRGMTVHLIALQPDRITERLSSATVAEVACVDASADASSFGLLEEVGKVGACVSSSSLSVAVVLIHSFMSDLAVKWFGTISMQECQIVKIKIPALDTWHRKPNPLYFECAPPPEPPRSNTRQTPNMLCQEP